jgi:hypothetical protein
MKNKPRHAHAAYAELACDDATRNEAWSFARGVVRWANNEVFNHPMYDYRSGMKDVRIGVSDTDAGVLVHFRSFKEERLTECNALAAASEMAFKAGVLPTMAVYTIAKYIARLTAWQPKAKSIRHEGKCSVCKQAALLSYTTPERSPDPRPDYERCGHYCGACGFSGSTSRLKAVANV